jgi:hypothetical protein
MERRQERGALCYFLECQWLTAKERAGRNDRTHDYCRQAKRTIATKKSTVAPERDRLPYNATRRVFFFDYSIFTICPQGSKQQPKTRPKGGRRIENNCPQGSKQQPRTRPKGGRRIDTNCPQGSKRMKITRPKGGQHAKRTRPKGGQ